MMRPLVLVLVLSTAACGDPEVTVQGRASVIDGDTLEIQSKRIRLWGVDAPEARQTCDVGGRQEPCGRIAANRLDQFIDGRPVACFEEDQDRFGRMVARCRVGDEDLGAWLVREGLALRYARYSGPTYLVEEVQARRDRRGGWAGEFQNPEDWRRRQREE